MAEPDAGMTAHKPVFYVSYKYYIEGVRSSEECPKGAVAFEHTSGASTYTACVDPKRLFETPPQGAKPISERVPLKWGSTVKTQSGQEGFFVGSDCPYTVLDGVGVYLSRSRRIECFEESALTLVRPPVKDKIVVGSHVRVNVETTLLGGSKGTMEATAVVVGIDRKRKQARVIVDMVVEGIKKVPFESLSLQSPEGE